MVYIQKGDPACEQAQQDLAALQESIPHQLVLVDIDGDPALKSSYANRVPSVVIGPYRLAPPFARQDLQVALGAARDRQDHLETAGDEAYQKRLQRGHTLSGADRFSDWFSRHYMLVFNLCFFLYVGLPFLAPVFMKVGWKTPAKVIYTIYSPLCHQLAFRSWFLFGEQAYYPRTLAGIPGVLTYADVTGDTSEDPLKARAFIGNEQLGYKVAICERDVAIYGSILLFGLVFSLIKGHLKSPHWMVWLAIGVVPIAIDGVSQLPSLMTGLNISWLPMRESTPFLRTLTGFLFGVFTAWYGFPYVEEAMGETRRLLAQKIAVIRQTLPPRQG